jgi:hypothetical protein
MPEKHSGLGHEGVLHSPRYAVLLCAALITASFAVSGAIAGATNSAPNSAASALTISNPPSASAPLSVWETWSYQQQAFMQGTNWVQALSTSRCQVTEVTVDSVTSDGSYGIPRSRGLKPAVPLPRAIQFRHSPRPTVPFKHLGITHPSRAAWPA